MVARWTIPAGVTGDVGGGVAVAVLALVTTPGAAAMEAPALAKVGVSAGRSSKAAGVTGEVGGGGIVPPTAAAGRRAGSGGRQAARRNAKKISGTRWPEGRLKLVFTRSLSWAGDSR